MWILKNSKDLLDNFKSLSFSEVYSLKTFDFSTLYITLSHDKLKCRPERPIETAFSNSRNFVIYGYNSTFFSKTSYKDMICYTFDQLCSMLDFIYLLTTYLSHLEDRFFIKLAFQWAHTVLLF